ncbi:RICIN domain-containing protein [Streptomyces mashuensis]|nr:RICIN domain-containing protein [Streptomyces mashuensis]
MWSESYVKIASRVAALAASGAAVALLTPGVSSAAPVPGPYQYLVNNYSNQCLQLASTSGQNGDFAVQGFCENGLKAQWRIERVNSSRDFRIINALTGKCLEIADSRKDNGAPAQQWTCANGYDTQLWQFDFANDRGLVINKNSGKILEISNSSIEPGAPAQQWQYGGMRGQIWRTPVVPGSGTPTPDPQPPTPTPGPTTQPSSKPTVEPTKAPTDPTKPTPGPTSTPPSRPSATPAPALR